MARWSKLGIIAGGGALPERVARACAGRGDPLYVVRLSGIADALMDSFPGDECGIAEAGKIIRCLKDAGCDAVVLAGVVKRPDFRQLKPDWRAAALMPKLIAAAGRGDGALLRVIVETLESEGFIVVGAEEATNELTSPQGPLGRLAPDDLAFSDIRKGAAVINSLGQFDIGQGAVVASGLILAVEAAEGTDLMLDRCVGLGAREGERSGVLVKRPKPGQELRVDLPTIGIETVRRAHRAHLAGIAVEAGVTLIIDADETAGEADARGLFVYGFTEAELRKT